MEELNFCPFKQTHTLCQTTDCALRINGHCAFVDIAVSLAEITASMKEAVNELSFIPQICPKFAVDLGKTKGE